MSYKTITLCAVTVTCALAVPSDRATARNEEVVKFCQTNLGQKVGSGECADLANCALLAAGAKPRRAYSDFPKDGDYVWGQLVASVEVTKGGKKYEGKMASALPGDILQFGGAEFKGKRNGQKYTARAAHHTAILLKVSRDGRELKVLEQNRNGEKVVSEGEVRLGDLKQGWVRIYRPTIAEDGAATK